MNQPVLYLGADLDLLGDGPWFVSPDLTTQNCPSDQVGVCTQYREQIAANLVSNPNFETDTSGLAAPYSRLDLSRITNSGASGVDTAMRIAGNQDSTAAYLRWNTSLSMGYAGQRIRASLQARLIAGHATRVSFYARNGDVSQHTVRFDITPSPVWQKFESITAAPTDITSVAPWFEFAFTDASNLSSFVLDVTNLHISNMTTDPYTRIQRYTAVDGSHYTRSLTLGGDWTDWATVPAASTVGASLVTAASQAAARTAIGAGTSSLALGSSGTTAMAGNKTAAQIGGVAVASGQSCTVWTGTESEYAAIGSPDADTLYFTTADE